MAFIDKERLEQMKRQDDLALEESLEQVIKAVMGRSIRQALSSSTILDKVVSQVLSSFHMQSEGVNIADDGADEEDIAWLLETRLRPYGIMFRAVQLSDGWRNNACGIMLGTLKETGKPVVFVQGRFGGYRYNDIESGESIKITGKNEAIFDDEALVFYKPLPDRSLKTRDLFAYTFKSLNKYDILLYIASLIMVTLVGTLTPSVTRTLYAEISERYVMSNFIVICVFLLCSYLSLQLFKTLKKWFTERIKRRTGFALESALMMRALSMKTDFYGKYTPGELSQRLRSGSELMERLTEAVFVSGFSAITSLIYITQIFKFAPALVVPSVIIIVNQTLLSIAATITGVKISRRQKETRSRSTGQTHFFIRGIQKIKLSGAEKRVFARWAASYSQEAKSLYDTPLFYKLSSVISMAISLFGAIIIYVIAGVSGLDATSYYAFTIAFSLMAGAFGTLTDSVKKAADIIPSIEMLRPVLKAEPENNTEKEAVRHVNGNIELSHVTFRYEKNQPPVIDDLSLNINEGEYVAVCGASGCGKTTLMRLILGLYTPERGTISIDGRDISRLDLRQLRRHIGTVIQGESLLNDSIYNNITLTCSDASEEDVWEAAGRAAIAEDILEMPMGMNTLITEGSGGISGGQKQRILIARAIVSKPGLLIFDEATSALDNITQKKVADSLAHLNCTRLVIAHRLSTIRSCDRIIVMDKGKVVESGSFDELIKAGGIFAQLAKKQI